MTESLPGSGLLVLRNDGVDPLFLESSDARDPLSELRELMMSSRGPNVNRLRSTCSPSAPGGATTETLPGTDMRRGTWRGCPFTHTVIVFVS